MNSREILDTICKSYPIVLSYVIKHLASYILDYEKLAGITKSRERSPTQKKIRLFLSN